MRGGAQSPGKFAFHYLDPRTSEEEKRKRIPNKKFWGSLFFRIF